MPDNLAGADHLDVLVLGGGPAALCISSELNQRGVAVGCIAPDPVDAPWPNTYGIWSDELKAVGLEPLLEHRWSDTVSYFGAGGSTAQDQSHAHGIDYGLFDRAALQSYWLERADGVVWHQDTAHRVEVKGATTTVSCASGTNLQARLVIDASGSRTPHIRRPDQGPVAGQAAYGVVGRFSQPPIEPGRFVLMDYRCDHLGEEQRQQPPTFLYAMDLGDGVFFVEETSLALAPGFLRRAQATAAAAPGSARRGDRRGDPRGVLPVPDEPAAAGSQPTGAGLGGAASMVHPASGYMVDRCCDADLIWLRPWRMPSLIQCWDQPRWHNGDGKRWPMELVLRHQLYQFGLGRLMGFNQALLRTHSPPFSHCHGRSGLASSPTPCRCRG